ncbi:MAG: ribulose-phosphate 3-epimerase [Myxococcota bacterium]|nr:ribulose-phosphate 3-epimerase [Myxococcota bacterium]
MAEPQIAPSILAADFSILADEVAAVERAGAHIIHVDVMDGHFVPNLTLGPPIVASLRPRTALPLDCHLMVENPDELIAPFIRAGADMISVHVETCPHLHRTIQQIRSIALDVGRKVLAGVVLNPGTPVSSLEWIIGDIDYVLVMSVNPGFGGQSFIPSSLEKIRQLRAMANARNQELIIQIDGGVKENNAALCREAGVDWFVAGSAIFRKGVGEGHDRYCAVVSRFMDAIHGKSPHD